MVLFLKDSEPYKQTNKYQIRKIKQSLNYNLKSKNEIFRLRQILSVILI